MDLISRKEIELYKQNEEQIVMFGDVYPKHTLILTKKIVNEFETHTVTTFELTVIK